MTKASKALWSLLVWTYSNTGLISLDQEKAFDRVEHNFLWEVMEIFRFSAGFIAKIKVLYSEVET